MSAAVCVATLAETRALGHALGRWAPPGLVVGLIGPLGAGKTTFARAVAAGAGCPPEAVSSPTFVLIHEYLGGRVPVVHADAYRLRAAEDFGKLGMEEHFPAALCLVEWADRVRAWLPDDRVEIAFANAGADRRRLSWDDPAGAHAELRARLPWPAPARG